MGKEDIRELQRKMMFWREEKEDKERVFRFIEDRNEEFMNGNEVLRMISSILKEKLTRL